MANADGIGLADGTAALGATLRIAGSPLLVGSSGLRFNEGQSRSVRRCRRARWECPQFAWELGVLLVGSWRQDTGPIAVLAIKGVERHGELAVADVELADHGPDFYAPSLMRAQDGRYLLWGVIREGRDSEWRDETGWAGMLSLPREISLQDGRLSTRPARELTGLRGELCAEYVGSSSGALLEELPRAFELLLRLDHLPETVTLELDFGADQALAIHLDRVGGKITIDRDRASSDSRAHRGKTIIESIDHLLAPDTLELRWFIDHSVSELFVADSIVATSRFFPLSREPWRIRVTMSGVCDLEARVWPLRPSVRLAPAN